MQHGFARQGHQVMVAWPSRKCRRQSADLRAVGSFLFGIATQAKFLNHTSKDRPRKVHGPRIVIAPSVTQCTTEVRICFWESRLCRNTTMRSIEALRLFDAREDEINPRYSRMSQACPFAMPRQKNVLWSAKIWRNWFDFIPTGCPYIGVLRTSSVSPVPIEAETPWFSSPTFLG